MMENYKLRKINMKMCIVCWNSIVTKLWIVMAFSIAITPLHAEAQGDSHPPSRESGLDSGELKSAVLMARGIAEMTKRIDSKRGDYSKENVQQIHKFYRYGSGTEEEPGNALVTKKFCREFVLCLLCDAFLVELSADGKPMPDPEGFQNPLSDESARRLLALLKEIIPNAHEDLSFIQRTRVYRLAGKVLRPANTDAVNALKSLASQPGIDEDEGEMIGDVIKRIGNRQ